MPSANWSQTASSNGGPGVGLHGGLHLGGEILVVPVPPAEATSAKLGGSRPRLARSYTAGMSFFRARSPVTPKSTSDDGPAIRFSRRSRGSRSGLRPGPDVPDPLPFGIWHGSVVP